MKIKHFIVTRFNVPTDWKVKDGWEFNLRDSFNNFASKSVFRQSNLDFQWIIYHGEEGFSNRLRAILSFAPIPIILIGVESYDEFQSRYMEDVKALCSDADYLLTTRFDADDLLGKDYVSVMQTLAKKFASKHTTVFNPVRTYKLSKDLTKLWIDYKLSGHFVSVLSPFGENAVGCYDLKDSDWNKYYKVRQVADDDLVCEIISDTNVINKLRGFPYLKAKLLSKFNVHEIVKTSLFDKQNFKIWLFSWRKYLIYKFRLKEQKQWTN